jgi:hypothetical protein
MFINVEKRIKIKPLEIWLVLKSIETCLHSLFAPKYNCFNSFDDCESVFRLFDDFKKILIERNEEKIKKTRELDEWQRS